MTLKKFLGRLLFLVVSEAILNCVALLIKFVNWRLDNSECQLFLFLVKLQGILQIDLSDNIVLTMQCYHYTCDVGYVSMLRISTRLYLN